MEDVDEPRSLIIALTHDQNAFPHPVSIIRLDSSPPNPNHPNTGQSFEIDFVARVSRPPHPIGYEVDTLWRFALPSATSPEDLYIFPYCNGPEPIFRGALPIIIFNSSTKNCKIIKAPPPTLHLGYSAVAVIMGDLIYFLTRSSDLFSYDTLLQSWEELVPLTPYDHSGWPSISIDGSAVLDDSILFTFINHSTSAYNVKRKKWYAVNDSNQLCLNIEGEALVIDNIIYALRKDSPESLVAFSINSREKDDDLEYTCELVMHYEVPGIGQGQRIVDEDIDYIRMRRYFVHFGKKKFGVVWTYRHENGIQNIQVTCVELISETKSTVTNICVHGFKISPGDLMLIERCFSLPNRTSNAFKEGTRLTNLEDEAEAEIVTLPPEPFLEKYRAMEDRFSKQGGDNTFESTTGHEDTTAEVWEDVPKKSSASVAAKSNFPTKASKSRIFVSALGEVAASGRSNTEGHYIYVRNLPHDFNLGQLEKIMKKFGPVKDISIHADHGDHMSGCWVADVEFERADSKQNAVKESVITVGGREVLIEQKRGFSLTQYRTRGGSSSGSIKAKNNGKDSGSKTTSGGYNVGKKSRNGQLKRGRK